MIDRFGREVVPMSVFQQKRPMAAQLAFGSTTRPSSSMHDPVALLPPPQVWRPRPVSEEIGSLGWNTHGTANYNLRFVQIYRDIPS